MKTRAISMAVIAVLAAVLVFMAGSSDTARAHHADSIAHAGYDLFQTDSGGTWLSFGNLPLPGAMFGPGCDNFTGIVDGFKGMPFDTFDPDGPGPQPTFSGLTPTDTIVKRLQDAGPTFPDTIDIEIVRLELVSVAPITVTGCTGGDQQWELKAQVPEGDTNQNPGTMTISHEYPDGGTFVAEFPIDPIMTFTRVGGGPGSPIGPGYLSAFGFPVFVLATPEADWCHEATIVGARITLDPAHPPNFFPGIDCGSGTPPGPGTPTPTPTGPPLSTGTPVEEHHLPPWDGRHTVLAVAGPVGGTVEQLVGGPDTASSPADGSGSSFPYVALAGGLAAVLALATASGWYVRRRWLQ